MGKVLGIRNGNIVSLYAHLSRVNVQKGDFVKQGDLIAFSGDTGKACLSPHLHFELRDISKSSLKEMVFEPVFDQEITQHKNEFTYVVNNTNTKKSLSSLSLMYFGNSHYWALIRDKNNAIKDFDANKTLPDRLEVTIPYDVNDC